jgi:YbbR domain-containing protein
VDITGAKEDVVKRVALALPEGVSVLSDSGVQVRVAVTPIMGGQTVRRTVTLSGLTRDLLATISPDAVEVILSGPLPTLASLTTGEVQVVVDVLGLSPGTYQLKPRVILIPDGLKVESIVPDTVEVEISPQ